MRFDRDMSVIRAENLNQRSRSGERAFFPTGFLGKILVRSSTRPAGLSTQTGHPVPEPGSATERPLSTQWIPDDLLADTRRVWSKAYGRVISEDEAIEILMNVRRLTEVLLRAIEEMEP